MRLTLIDSPTILSGVSLTPFQTTLVAAGVVGFLALLLAAWGGHRYFYRRFGYPAAPDWRSRISLNDTLDIVCEKLGPALHDGFRVKRRDDVLIVIEKTFADPPCVMTAEYHRGGHLSWQKFSVVCVDRKWLNWAESSGGNRWNIGRRRTTSRPGNLPSNEAKET